MTVVEEQIVYTFNELIADIGGGLGLYKIISSINLINYLINNLNSILGLILGLSVVKLIELMFLFTSQLKVAYEKQAKPIVSSIKVIFLIEYTILKNSSNFHAFFLKKICRGRVKKSAIFREGPLNNV